MKDKLYFIITLFIFVCILLITQQNNTDINTVSKNTTITSQNLEHSDNVPSYYTNTDVSKNTKDNTVIKNGNEQTETVASSNKSSDVSYEKELNTPKIEYVQKKINGVEMLIPKSIANESSDYIENKMKTATTGQFFKEEVVRVNLDFNNVNSKDWVISKEVFAQSDYEVLAHLLQSEAGEEPYDGKVAVANVVLNRAKKASTDIKSIIFQRKQFDGTQTKWFLIKPSEDCYKAAKEALSGKNIVPSSLHFCNLNLSNPRWAHELKFIVRIGDHWFFE